MSDAAATHEPTLAESDNPKVLIIALVVVFSVALVAAMVIGVLEFYQFAVRDEISVKELRPVDPRLTELRAQETERLTSYQYVDKAQGIVRIPVDLAAELTLRDWNKRPGGLKGESAANPAPATAPTQPEEQKGKHR